MGDVTKIILNTLKSSELFKGITIPSNNVSFQSIKKGQILDNICDNSIVLIAEGQVDVYSTSITGDEIYLSTLYVGDCVGINNIFATSNVKTGIFCGTDVKIISISKIFLIELMQNDFELVTRFLTIYNKKIQFLLDRIENLTIQSARVKLIVYLLKNQHDCRIKLVNREKIASYLGISRATLFREISFLKKCNAIKTDKRFLYIENVTELKKHLY